MLTTPSIEEVPASRPDLFAFRIRGTVTRDDFAAMGERMLAAFDARSEPVDMLLIFDGYEGSETLAGLSWSGVESRVRSLRNVRRYVVASAPDAAATMVEAIGRLLPLDAEAFEDERSAWAYLEAEPSP